MPKDAYKEKVINPGDLGSKLAHKICAESYDNNPAVMVVPHLPGNFRGPTGFLWRGHILSDMMKYTIHREGENRGKVKDWTVLEEIENDGAGGKPQFFTLLGEKEAFRGLGWEIITMTADDFARSGRFPAVIVNQMDTKEITDRNFPLFQAVMEGYGEALKSARLVNLTGELAIMKHSITAFCDDGSDEQFILTWGAACVGLAHRDLLIDGSKIRPNMSIIGFSEFGYRCNGGTFFTNLILKKFGPKIEQILKNRQALNFVKDLTVPSQSYAWTISRLLGWDHRARGWPLEKIEKGPLVRIYGIAHITGGGVWGKFGELLPEGVGARLHSMPAPAPVLREAQDLSWKTDDRLTDWRAYSTLHGGCGMLLVCHPDDAGKIIIEARKDGVFAQIVGKTVEAKNNLITIKSRFREGKTLYSIEPE